MLIFAAFAIGCFGSALLSRRIPNLSGGFRILVPMLGGALGVGVLALYVVATH